MVKHFIAVLIYFYNSNSQSIIGYLSVINRLHGGPTFIFASAHPVDLLRNRCSSIKLLSVFNVEKLKQDTFRVRTHSVYYC